MKHLHEQPQSDEPLLLSINQVAQLLQLSQRTVWAWAKAGKLPVIRFGRALRFPKKALERWVEEQVGNVSGKEAADER